MAAVEWVCPSASAPVAPSVARFASPRRAPLASCALTWLSAPSVGWPAPAPRSSHTALVWTAAGRNAQTASLHAQPRTTPHDKHKQWTHIAAGSATTRADTHAITPHATRSQWGATHSRPRTAQARVCPRVAAVSALLPCTLLALGVPLSVLLLCRCYWPPERWHWERRAHKSPLAAAAGTAATLPAAAVKTQFQTSHCDAVDVCVCVCVCACGGVACADRSTLRRRPPRA